MASISLAISRSVFSRSRVARSRLSLTQCVQFIMSLGLNDKKVIENLEDLGPEHQIMKPNLITGQTAFGEVTKPGSQVEMSKTPQSWNDPILHVPGSCKPQWLTQ